MPPRSSTGHYQTLCSVSALTALDFRAPELATSPGPQGSIEESPQALDMRDRDGTPQTLDVGGTPGFRCGGRPKLYMWGTPQAMDVGVHPGLWT